MVNFYLISGLVLYNIHKMSKEKVRDIAIDETLLGTKANIILTSNIYMEQNIQRIVKERKVQVVFVDPTGVISNRFVMRFTRKNIISR